MRRPQDHSHTNLIRAAVAAVCLLGVLISGLGSWTVASVGAATSDAAGAEPAPGSGPSPIDIAKFLFESLRARANTPECLKTPPAPSCKDVPFGDLLRFFTSPTEKALAEISAKLDEISRQLTALQSAVEELHKALDQNTYTNIVGFMRPEVVQQAMLTFANVARSCGESQTSTFCRTELGDNTPDKPGALRSQIRTSLIDSGVLLGMPGKVSGANGTAGILQIWPNVVKNQSNLFTAQSSARLLGVLNYFFDLEMSAVTLAVNYWRWEGLDESTIQQTITTYQNAVTAQTKVFSPLPKGVFIDVRSGLMWSTSVFCGTYSQYGQRETGKCPATYAGYPITDQRFVRPAYPYEPYFTACTQGTWCMGQLATVQALLRGASQPWAQWLRTQAGVTFNGPGEFDTWTYDLTKCQWFGGGGKPPFCGNSRYFINWERSEVMESYLPDHHAGWYLFVRSMNDTARYY